MVLHARYSNSARPGNQKQCMLVSPYTTVIKLKPSVRLPGRMAVQPQASKVVQRLYVACQHVSACSTPNLFSLNAVSYNTFPGALKEEANNEDLQPCHGHNQARLHQTEVEYPLLCTLDSAEVAVLARAEVFLITGDGGELCGKLEDGFF
jgi:hypothetical protein